MTQDNKRNAQGKVTLRHQSGLSLEQLQRPIPGASDCTDPEHETNALAWDGNAGIDHLPGL